MHIAKRLSAFALACLMSIACAGTGSAQGTPAPEVPQWLAEMLDASKLPRMPGSQELFADRATTSFVVRGKVGEAADATRALLTADGWKEYAPPFAQRAQSESFALMTLKKGHQALDVAITVAPAQGGATAVQYTPIVMQNDLPFPDDATSIAFSPERPHLNCITAGSAESTLQFFSRELGARGYSEWSTRTGAKKNANEKTGEDGRHAYFVHDEKKPLQLLLTQEGDKLKVELKAAAKPLLETRARPARSATTEAQMVDLTTLPRPDGAYVKDEDAHKSDARSVRYMVPAGIAATRAAVGRLLGADGWVAFDQPLEPANERRLQLKKNGQSLSLHFTTDGSNTTRSGVWITTEWLYNNIPFPPGATDIVFDHRRPLLDAIAPGTVEGLLAFFEKELIAAGWSAWSTEDAARYPNARIEQPGESEVRAYFTRAPGERQEPIQVTLGRRADSRVDVEVRVPPFARPQELAAGSEMMGLPKPERIKSAGGRDGQTRREVTATIPAERDVVLAFYRREMARRNWKEDARGPMTRDDEIVLNFSTTDSTAVLTVGTAYDLTTVSLVQQLPDRIVQARAKARQEEEERLRKRAEEWLREPVTILGAGVGPSNTPIPVPDTAAKVDFDRARGDLKFESTSGVRELAAFYRVALKERGFRENHTPIDNDGMAALDFVRGGKRLYVSIMKMGNRTDVRSYGPGLLALAAEPASTHAKAAPQPALEDLEADETDGLPVPKQHTMSLGSKSTFSNGRDATVTASLESTLAFYRRELGKLGWKEEARGAIVKADRVALSFTTPDGPGTLTLGRADGKTTVKLSQRKQAEAERRGVIAKPGMGRIMLGSLLETESVVTINRQTIKVAPGGGQKGDGPMLDLKPGTYKASVKVPGKPAFNEDIKVVAGQTLGLLIGPGGVLPLQVY